MKPTPLSAARAAPVDWRALAAATAACALIAATSLIAKLLGGAGAGAEALHPLQISAGRFALGVAAAFALMRPGFQGTPWPTHGARALCGWLGVTCFFAASTRIPLADATAISFLSPLFAIGFAALILRETVRRPQIAGALIATFGAALLLAPGEAGLRPAAFIALAAAALMGLETIFIKRLSDREPPVRILFVNNVFGAALACAAAAFVWRAPSAEQWAYLVALGVTMAAAQALFIQAMRRGAASRIAPILNFTLIFAAAYDFILFSAVPTAPALAGAVLIVFGVLVVTRR